MTLPNPSLQLMDRSTRARDWKMVFRPSMHTFSDSVSLVLSFSHAGVFYLFYDPVHILGLGSDGTQS